MTFCTNCGKENTHRLDDANGHPYVLEDDLNNWGDYCKGEHNVVTYTGFLCDDCGNFFALGELDPRAKFPKGEGVSYTISLDLNFDKILQEALDKIEKTSKSDSTPPN